MCNCGIRLTRCVKVVEDLKLYQFSRQYTQCVLITINSQNRREPKYFCSSAGLCYVRSSLTFAELGLELQNVWVKGFSFTLNYY